MNINFAGVAAAAAGLGAFQLTFHFLRLRSVPARLAVLCASALLSIPAILFAVYYLHVLPEQTWFYTLRSWWGSEFLMVFPGCAAGAVASLLPRFLAVVPLFAFLALAVAPYLKPIMNPLPDNVFSDQWRGDACLQSTASTCGPASLCTVLKRLGIASSEQEAARAAFSCTTGTEAWYLARYARGKGLAARFDLRDTFSPSVGLPAVVGVQLGGVGHFIAVLAMNGGEVIFADPMVGEEHLPLERFQSRYEFTGFHMSVARRN